MSCIAVVGNWLTHIHPPTHRLRDRHIHTHTHTHTHRQRGYIYINTHTQTEPALTHAHKVAAGPRPRGEALPVSGGGGSPALVGHGVSHGVCCLDLPNKVTVNKVTGGGATHTGGWEQKAIIYIHRRCSRL